MMQTNPTITHTMAIKMDIFDNEWKPLLKLFNRAVTSDEIMSHFDDEECDRLTTFMECLQELALENSK